VKPHDQSVNSGLAGKWQVKKTSIALALCCSFLCTPVSAKTFVGVLYPLFGPVAALGLVDLVSELKSMPDVEVVSYLHQAWPYLVDDINRQPSGTHTLIIGYSLGANNAVLVANRVSHVDSIIALQPSMFTSSTTVTGDVGRIVEIYNPNPWMTFGGMGSRKLVGPNVEYIVNNDTHPGAQFNSEFRNLVKTEIARLSAADDQNTTDELITPETRIPAAQYPAPQPPVVAYPPPAFDPSPASSPGHLGAYPYGSPGVQPAQDRGTMVAALPPEYQPEGGSAKTLSPRFQRTVVDYSTVEAPGTIIIDTPNTYLYFTMGHGKALRYGIGVGREGFTWSGTEHISRMKEWPDWFPPQEMIKRQPYLPRFMAGGETNPLGARAMYLGNTQYRIHGTNQPSTIGTFVSSGCIRLTNEDVEDLYSRVTIGTTVVVLPGANTAASQLLPRR
jgi:lipoprotein-anchoring transpeptidase ErfK/SrfK